MTLREAVALGIERVRLPHWKSPAAHIKISLFPGGGHGIWMRLYDEPTQKAIGAETPQSFPWSDDGRDDWQEWKAISGEGA